MKTLYATATNITNPLAITVNESHSATNTVASIECTGFSGTIGDNIVIDLGYSDSHGTIFTGYVKSVEKNVPENLYTITASDKLIRAVDFFAVPDSPTSCFTRTNISAEDLVEDVLALAGITGVDSQATSYTLAVNGTQAEVKLISAYDYCKSISDLIAWHLWAGRDGTVHFRNRKPYVMTGLSGQPGDTADSPMSGKSVITTNSINTVYRVSEVDLRNKVVVWGKEGITASASEESAWLPDDFYKTVLFSSEIIDTQSMADYTADYNLYALHRLTRELSASVLGDYELEARKAITVTLSDLGLSETMYIYSSTHTWSAAGYETSLVLRG